MLRNSEHVWVDDPHEIEILLLDHFKTILKFQHKQHLKILINMGKILISSFVNFIFHVSRNRTNIHLLRQ